MSPLLSDYLNTRALIYLMKGVVNILVEYSWPGLSYLSVHHPLHQSLPSEAFYSHSWRKDSTLRQPSVYGPWIIAELYIWSITVTTVPPAIWQSYNVCVDLVFAFKICCQQCNVHKPVSIQRVTTKPIFLAQLAIQCVCLSVLLFLISESRGSLSTTDCRTCMLLWRQADTHLGD